MSLVPVFADKNLLRVFFAHYQHYFDSQSIELADLSARLFLPTFPLSSPSDF